MNMNLLNRNYRLVEQVQVPRDNTQTQTSTSLHAQNGTSRDTQNGDNNKELYGENQLYGENKRFSVNNSKLLSKPGHLIKTRFSKPEIFPHQLVIIHY